MKVYAEFEVDTSDLSDYEIDELLSQWTHEIRVSRRLISWNISTRD